MVLVLAVLHCCFAWLSEKPCLFITTSEGSLSTALISDLLPVGVVAVAVVVVGGGGVVVVVVGGGGAVVAVDVVAAPDAVVGVCAWWPLLLLLLLWFISLSSAHSASLSSC